jgi:hypothetical protein
LVVVFPKAVLYFGNSTPWPPDADVHDAGKVVR